MGKKHPMLFLHLRQNIPQRCATKHPMSILPPQTKHHTFCMKVHKHPILLILAIINILILTKPIGMIGDKQNSGLIDRCYPIMKVCLPKTEK